MTRAQTAKEPRRRGRPPELSRAERERRILDATETLLVRDGLDRASMTAIARAAGMSKRTLYEVFADRSELFAACVRRLRGAFVRPLAAADRELPLAERLRRIFEPRDHAVDLSAPIGVLRAVILEAHRQPELGRAFLREGPADGRAIVQAELERAVARGEIRLADPALGATILFDMVYENPIDRLVDPSHPPRSMAEARRRLDTAIAIFLNGLSNPRPA